MNNVTKMLNDEGGFTVEDGQVELAIAAGKNWIRTEGKVDGLRRETAKALISIGYTPAHLMSPKSRGSESTPESWKATNMLVLEMQTPEFKTAHKLVKAKVKGDKLDKAIAKTGMAAGSINTKVGSVIGKLRQAMLAEIDVRDGVTDANGKPDEAAVLKKGADSRHHPIAKIKLSIAELAKSVAKLESTLDANPDLDVGKLDLVKLNTYLSGLTMALDGKSINH